MHLFIHSAKTNCCSLISMQNVGSSKFQPLTWEYLISEGKKFVCLDETIFITSLVVKLLVHPKKTFKKWCTSELSICLNHI